MKCSVRKPDDQVFFSNREVDCMVSLALQQFFIMSIHVATVERNNPFHHYKPPANISLVGVPSRWPQPLGVCENEAD